MDTTKSLNYLLPSKATLDIMGAENFSFNVQIFKIPRLYGFISEHPTPHLTVPIPGNKLVYDVLEVSFLISENLESWLELHNWMRGIYQPYGSPEYKNKKLYLQDAVLTIYTAANNPFMKIKFIDMFPVKLDEIIFDVSETLADPIKTKVEFAFRNYDIEYLN
jgi:hypothetical protein